jgi:hypothetical protein
MQASSYILAKHLIKKLNHLINLSYAYVTKNAKEVAQELSKIQIKDQHKIITLDIKYLYVNLLVQNIIRLFLARQSPLGQGLLIHEVSISHTTTHHSR